MTRNDLAREVAKATGLTPEQADGAIVVAIETIKNSVCKGENVYLRGFGTIMRKLRAAKIGRNVALNQPMNIPARFIPAIKFSQDFADSMPKP